MFISPQVYLSALDILKRDFGGKRLSLLLCNLQAKNINPNMTNFWPYLRARHREKEINRTLFDKTWVAAFFRHIVSGFPVTPRMWESPDDSRQLEIIARWVVRYRSHSGLSNFNFHQISTNQNIFCSFTTFIWLPYDIWLGDFYGHRYARGNTGGNLEHYSYCCKPK